MLITTVQPRGRVPRWSRHGRRCHERASAPWRRGGHAFRPNTRSDLPEDCSHSAERLRQTIFPIAWRARPPTPSRRAATSSAAKRNIEWIHSAPIASATSICSTTGSVAIIGLPKVSSKPRYPQISRVIAPSPPCVMECRPPPSFGRMIWLAGTGARPRSLPIVCTLLWGNRTISPSLTVMVLSASPSILMSHAPSRT